MMGYVRRAQQFMVKNPALDFAGGLVVTIATVTPFWIYAGIKSEPTQPPQTDTDSPASR